MAQRPPSALARLHCPRSIHIVHFCANGVSVACMKEQVLLDHLLHLPDLQCVWLLVLMCANTRANHALRNIPPEDVRPYAEGRDRAVCTTHHDAAGMPWGENGRRRASRVHSLGRCSNACDAGRAGLAPCHAPTAAWGASADTLGYWHMRNRVWRRHVCMHSLRSSLEREPH